MLQKFVEVWRIFSFQSGDFKKKKEKSSILNLFVYPVYICGRRYEMCLSEIHTPTHKKVRGEGTLYPYPFLLCTVRVVKAKKAINAWMSWQYLLSLFPGDNWVLLCGLVSLMTEKPWLIHQNVFKA